MLKNWEDLPYYMRTEAVRPYYDCLSKKRYSLAIKRCFDVIAAFILLLLLSPLLLALAVVIGVSSPGGVLFRQERVTQYGRKFIILKFRTMVADAERKGTQVTVSNDPRITPVGKILRKYRLDELPQLINILKGDMSFVGTRPESLKYVKQYTSQMMATLLLPAGVTSEASIHYKDEGQLLDLAKNVDEAYIKEVLPEKMKYNLAGIEKFGLIRDIRIMLQTVIAILR